MNAQNVSLYCSLAFGIVVLVFAFAILWKIFKGDISLEGLLAEAPALSVAGAKAGLPRFQFLIFTFVISGLFVLPLLRAGTFVDIPNNVLGPVGLTADSYLVSKAVK